MPVDIFGYGVDSDSVDNINGLLRQSVWQLNYMFSL